MTRTRLAIAWIVLGLLGAGAARLASPAPGADMAGAAQRFLDSLSPALRARAGLAFEEAARTDWHFVPRTRPGVTFGELDDAQRDTVRDLLRAGLSPRGTLKVEEIILLESILREVDKGTPDEALRDPAAYTIAVYGSPGARWGWKLEGHHISLNFTMPVEDQVRATPAFLGASPARVRRGLRAGLRVLAMEEDLARDLVRSLDESQRGEAIVEGEKPGQLLTGPGRSLESIGSAGLSYAKMTGDQRHLVEALLEEYAGNLRRELAGQELDRIRAAGMDSIVFAWAGGTEPGLPHYYRLSGPTFIIEYDNSQNNANHIHAVWHDRERDFGKDLLKEHYEHEHK